jgi:dephospho-CoA kinase
MLKVAITGGAGSGKSVICAEFEKLGVRTISLDKIAREVVQPQTRCRLQIVDYFGKTILKADNSIDRRRLREFIIADPDARIILQKITHPAILQNMKKRMKALETAFPEEIVVVEVPLLFECGLQDLFDATIVVSAPAHQRIDRLMRRDRVSDESAEALVNMQDCTEPKEKRADFAIENNAGLEDLSMQVFNIHRTFLTFLRQTDGRLFRSVTDRP